MKRAPGIARVREGEVFVLENVIDVEKLVHWCTSAQVKPRRVLRAAALGKFVGFRSQRELDEEAAEREGAGDSEEMYKVHFLASPSSPLHGTRWENAPSAQSTGAF